MIIRCNRGCKFKKGTVTGSVDLETKKVVCDHCGDDIENMSPFAVNSMISQGKVLKKEGTKAFQLKCSTCKKTVEAVSDGKNIVGRDCDGDCKFNITTFAMRAIKGLSGKSGDNE